MTTRALTSALVRGALREPGANLVSGTLDRDLVLASTSASLRRLLEGSGLAVRVAPPDDEEMNTLRTSLLAGSEDLADVAELHVRTKIDRVVELNPGALVLGAQQIVSLDGKLREPPRTLDAARDLLIELCGKTHQLHSAIALAEEGQVTWIDVETMHMTMRPFSDSFVEWYLSTNGLDAIGCPGAYELNDFGLQLFFDQL